MKSEVGIRRLELRRAFTLLEVILALGLTVVIFSAIAAGIRLHLVSIANQQTRIEQRQLARNLLATMGRDIRAAVLYRAVDFSGLENINTTKQKQRPTADSDVDTSIETESEAVEGDKNGDGVEDIIQEEKVSYRPVLKGNERSILFDISRLPRLDQYRSFGAETIDSIQTTPSDIKSIAYFFSDIAASSEPIQESTLIATGGLYRRELDRAIAAFNGSDKLTTTPDKASRLLASEVSGIRFRYYDGCNWWSTWDFDERGGLPTAIEIQITIDPARTGSTRTINSADSQESFYRSVIHLPLAEPCEQENE